MSEVTFPAILSTNRQRVRRVAVTSLKTLCDLGYLRNRVGMRLAFEFLSRLHYRIVGLGLESGHGVNGALPCQLLLPDRQTD